MILDAVFIYSTNFSWLIFLAFSCRYLWTLYECQNPTDASFVNMVLIWALRLIFSRVRST